MKKMDSSINAVTVTEIQDTLFEIMTLVDSFCRANNINYYLLGGSALGAIRHDGFIPWDDDIDIGMFREDYERFISIFPKDQGKLHLYNSRNSKNANYCLTRLYYSDIEINYPKNYNKKIDKHLYFDIFPIDDVPNSISIREKQRKRILFYNRIILLKSYLPSHLFKKLGVLLARFFLLPFPISYFSNRADKLFKRYHVIPHDKVCSMASQYSYKKQTFDCGVYGTPTPHQFRDKQFFVPEQYDVYLKQLFGDSYMEIPPIEKRRIGMKMYRTNPPITNE